MSPHRPHLLLAVAALATAPALADDPPEKRAEGRYFVEAAEIMVRANDFDVLLGTISNGGTSQDEVATLSDWNLDQPKILIGLNRPGKTSLVLGVHDFELKDERIPATFDDSGDQVATTTMLPPGILFQRQRPNRVTPPVIADDDFIPNWGEEFGFIRRMDYRSLDVSVHRTVFENKRFRLRALLGARYAQLETKTSLRMAFAEEAGPGFASAQVVGLESGPSNLETRDFLNVQAETSTHGVGPQLGLAGRFLAGKNSKWSFGAQGTLAYLPESTNASYALSLVDNSAEMACIDLDPLPGPGNQRWLCGNAFESPVIPGVPAQDPGNTFNAIVRQTDFTEATWLFEGTIGVRYQISRGISVGIEGWHLRWMNLLHDTGVIDQIHEEATYELVFGRPDSPDPQLRDTESVIHVPRFDRRKDVSFDGISLNLRFEF